jgi:low affinity Fe/Cu permease
MPPAELLAAFWELMYLSAIMTASPNKLIASAAGAAESDSRLPLFSRISNEVARLAGRPVTFALCCVTIVIWGVTGPIFHYSDTWQLIINTGTTIVTFLMVFLIQNTQNRDGAALQAKLDELIRATKEARNELIEIERQPEEKVEQVREATIDAASGAPPE